MPPKRRSRKKKNRFPFAGLLVIFLLALLVFFLTRWNRARQLSFVKYDALGISIPAAYVVHGIDVSRYQQSIDWKAVKEMRVQNIKLDFAFIKATEGESGLDPYFKKNWRASRRNGVIRGAYHYFIPTKDASQQAKFFIDNVQLLPGDLPPVLDIEQTNNIPNVLLKAKLLAWLTLVQSHYGVKPIVYTNADFYKKYLGNSFDDYPLWIAHYYQQNNPRINREWMFWQHNDGGNVDGIRHKVDFNVFNGDSAALRSLLYKGKEE